MFLGHIRSTKMLFCLIHRFKHPFHRLFLQAFLEADTFASCLVSKHISSHTDFALVKLR